MTVRHCKECAVEVGKGKSFCPPCLASRRRRTWRNAQVKYSGKEPVRAHPGASPIERFLVKIEVTDGGCWAWIGSLNGRGYGLFGDGGTRRAHRWAFEFWRHEIPAGMTVDHLCQNKKCVNPDHMEIVEHAENLRRYHRSVGRGSSVAA